MKEDSETIEVTPHMNKEDMMDTLKSRIEMTTNLPGSALFQQLNHFEHNSDMMLIYAILREINEEIRRLRDASGSIAKASPP